MKINFLLFKNNYRKIALVNFQKKKIYGKKIIVNFSGKINYLKKTGYLLCMFRTLVL